ncbi:MAG: hypothetical protein ABWZ29_02120 [Casimicrobiaceae bacterium]
MRRLSAVAEQSARPRSLLVALVLALTALAIAACAQMGTGPVTAPPEPPAPPTAPPLPANVEPPPAAVNLSGFPLPYRQGYADGCASATGPERKDAVRFGADGNYRTGWTDGLALCRKK